VKFAALLINAQYRQALVHEERLHPLPAGTDLFALLAAKPTQDEVLTRCESPIALAGQDLLPPVRPTSIRDFITFESHVEGSFQGMRDPAVVPEWYEIPTFYFTNPYALIGPTAPVPVPPGSKVFDFELEVAAIIGADGRNLRVEDAEKHIAGYSIFNDWSARDLQIHEMKLGLGPAKGKDTASTLGPYLVTPDELEPYRQGDRFDLTMSVSVNGTPIGKDSLANSAWSFPEMVAYASRGTEVRASDVLGSGTCGSGCLVELWGRNGGRQVPPPLAIGDTVTLEVTGLGTIENSVVAGDPVHPVPPARRAPLKDS
jgi:2-keto-4-pentenoate hydratase/2-oxohepta-3-ene-1,7-dioic acid hydratase in catechol pathway